MEFEKKLQGLMTLQDPGVMFTESVLAKARARRDWQARKHRRFVVIGACVVMAAAAAMVAWQMGASTDPATPSAVTSTLAPAPATPEPVVPINSPQPAPIEQKMPEAVVAPVQEEVEPFNVVVLPLMDEEVPASGKSAVASTYALLVELLHQVPGVRLQALEPEKKLAGQVEYRIKVKGSGPAPDGKLSIHMVATADVVRMMMGNPSIPSIDTNEIKTSMLLDAAPSCVSAPLVHGMETSAAQCADAQGVAAYLVGMLRQMVFPPDPSLGRLLKARVLDPSLDEQLRLRALTDLRSLDLRLMQRERPFSPQTMRNSVPAPPVIRGELSREPAVIRAAINLATTATDPVVRATVWATLRGAGNPELIPPLINVLRQDADSDVRLTVLSILSGEFSADARVHAALEEAALRDARPLVRALAHRAANGAEGEDAWRDYVQTSLKDSSRSATQRIEALSHADLQGILRQLDSDAITALTQVLPQAAADPSFRRGNDLVGVLGRMDHPAITGMLVTVLEGGGTWLDRGAAVRAVGAMESRRNDPRVRTMLERISAIDPDPQLRQYAAAVLRRAP